MLRAVSARVLLQDDSDYDDSDSGLLTVNAPDSMDVPVYYYVEQGNGSSPAMSPSDFMNTVISELAPSVGGRQIVFAPASAPLAGAPEEAVVLLAGRKLSQARTSPAAPLHSSLKPMISYALQSTCHLPAPSFLIYML